MQLMALAKHQCMRRSLLKYFEGGDRQEATITRAEDRHMVVRLAN